MDGVANRNGAIQGSCRVFDGRDDFGFRACDAGDFRKGDVPSFLVDCPKPYASEKIKGQSVSCNTLKTNASAECRLLHLLPA